MSQTMEPEPQAQPPTERGGTRRDFLVRLALWFNAAAATAFALPVLGYILWPVAHKSWLKWTSLGPVSEFPENQTRLGTYRNPFVKPWDGVTADIPCWVRRLSGDTFEVFAINCTHLGCPVRWFAESQLFMCPCHGGVYYANGQRASGPPPRNLYRYQYRVRQGQLWVLAGQLPTLGQPQV